ncbi:response regulator [Fusibacter bizertensis]
MIDYSKHTVLIVDDEIEILKSLNRGLHLEPYSKIFASSGAQALESFAREDQISVIITDMRMPGMNGLELLRQVEEISPKTVKIVLTGYTQLPQILATVNNVEIFKFMTKPWDLDAELKVYINEAIAIYENTAIEENRLVSSEKKGKLYNKMLSDSYEKVDHVLRLYDELIKALNQHHLFSIQALKNLNNQTEMTDVIQQMNDRVHYLNKIFEMNRFTMKTFTLQEIELNIEATFEKLGIPKLPIGINTSENQLYYYDNFKMITSILIDIIEGIHFNNSNIQRIGVKAESVDEKHVLHFVVDCVANEKLNLVFENHGKFVSAVLKIIGGKFYATNIEETLRIEVLLPVNKKVFDPIV